MNFAVLVSGNGSNLQAIIEAVSDGRISANLGLVISNNPEAFALTRCQMAGVESVVINHQDFETREAFDQAMIDALKEAEIHFVVLAGFMRILSPAFIQAYPNKILNIHPALLPEFKGAHAIRDAFEAGVEQTGVTIHLVDEEIDHGPTLLQERVEVEDDDSLESLEEKIHAVEHRLYPKAIEEFVQANAQSSL